MVDLVSGVYIYQQVARDLQDMGLYEGALQAVLTAQGELDSFRENAATSGYMNKDVTHICKSWQAELQRMEKRLLQLVAQQPENK